MDSQSKGDPNQSGKPPRDDQPDDGVIHSAEYPAYSPPVNKKPGRRPLSTILLILLVLTIGVVSYWLFFRPKPSQTTNQQTQSTQQNPPTTANSITTKTKHHTSNNFGLSFDYPEDWNVTETDENPEITVTSPALQLKNAAGGQMKGHVVFHIQNKQVKMPQFDKGNAIAARDSEKIAYTKPSASQRGSTYLSFLRYIGSADASIDGLFITGDTGYKKDQAVPKADFVPIDPIISFSFIEACESDCPTEAPPLAIDVNSWDDPSLANSLKALLASLTIN